MSNVTRKVEVCILAGGQGSRFWPISRAKCPKQFLSISTNGESLIQATARRLRSLASGGITVVTNNQHRELVLKHVPEARIISEPIGKNTAASIGLAAIESRLRDPEAVLIVVPADHSVADEQALLKTLQRAVLAASSGDRLVTVGIPPKYPHTGYGYIKRGQKIDDNCSSVSRFFEKPNLERAQQYLESGDYLWNSGMFVWRADTILASIREFMPQLYDGLTRIENAFNTPAYDQVVLEVFSELESVSIDFGILEHARNSAVVVADSFGWSDVGSWDAWAEEFEPDHQGNLLHGESVVVDSEDCVVYSKSSTIALIGCEDIVVIDSGDAILVCPRNRVQDVRLVVDELKKRGKVELV